jgi:ribose transport system ATP-binding protein
MTDRVAVFHAGRLRTVLDTRHTDQEEVMQHASGLTAAETP